MKNDPGWYKGGSRMTTAMGQGAGGFQIPLKSPTIKMPFLTSASRARKARENGLLMFTKSAPARLRSRVDSYLPLLPC